MAPIYGIIFDLMGTLATYTGSRDELHAAWRAGVGAVYRHLAVAGFNAPPEAFTRDVQAAFDAILARTGNPREISVADVLTQVLPRHGFAATPKQIEAAERAYFAPELAGWEALPGAVEAVESLNEEGYRLAVVSNAPSHTFVEEVVARIGLRPYFSPVMSSARAGARKPDPRLFQAVATEWYLDPANLVVVGDGLAADIAGARAAGMRGVLVHRDANPDNAGYAGDDAPDAALAAIADLPVLIAHWHTASGPDARPETGFVEDY